MEDWAPKFWDLLKVVLPWLTGGFAGAVLTYLLNQRSARRKQARLLLTIERADYSIALKDNKLGKYLLLSYEGREFDNIILYKIILDNSSNRTVKDANFLFVFQAGVDVVDWSAESRPLNRDTSWSKQEGHDNAYSWNAGELKPADSGELTLLLSPSSSLDWSWRGDDEVEVELSGYGDRQNIEIELRNIILWIAIYVSVDALPYFSALAHGLLLIFSMPYIIPRCLRFWYNLNSRKPNVWSVNAGAHSQVAVVVGERGNATLPPPGSVPEQGGS